MEGVAPSPSPSAGPISGLDADGNPLPPPTTLAEAHAVLLAAREAELLRHLELFLTLCTRKPGLLAHLFHLYPTQDPETQALLRTHVQTTVGALTTHGLLEELAPILPDIPAGSEELMHRMLVVIGERVTPPAALVEAAKRVISQRGLDARYLIPVLPGLTKVGVGCLLGVCAHVLLPKRMNCAEH